MKIKVIETGEILGAEISLSYDGEPGWWTGREFLYFDEAIDLKFIEGENEYEEED